MESGSVSQVLESFTERRVETVLRERGKSTLDDVPDLVVVVIGALPHLGGSPRINIPTGQIQTFALICPRDPLVVGDCKLLVGVPREAGVDLHLDAVCGGAVGDVEALIPENLNSSTGNSPRLRSRPITFLDRNSRIIRITRDSQTFARCQTGLDLFSFCGRSGAGVGEGPFLILATGAVPDLGRITSSNLPIRIIQTFLRSTKSNTPTSSRSPLLVRIPASACPNLHLLAIRLNTIRIVETFIPENLEGSRGSDGPELGGGWGSGAGGTVLDDDGCSVGVGGCSETFGGVVVWVDDCLGRSWGWSSGDGKGRC